MPPKQDAQTPITPAHRSSGAPADIIHQDDILKLWKLLLIMSDSTYAYRRLYDRARREIEGVGGSFFHDSSFASPLHFRMSARQARNLNFDKDEWTGPRGRKVNYNAICEAEAAKILRFERSSEIFQPENASPVKKRKRQDTESSNDSKPGPSKLHKLEAKIKELESSQNALSEELQKTKHLIEVEQENKNRAAVVLRATMGQAFTCAETFLDQEEIIIEVVAALGELGKYNIEITHK